MNITNNIVSDDKTFRAFGVTDKGFRFADRAINKHSKLHHLARYSPSDLLMEIIESGLKYVYVDIGLDGRSEVSTNISNESGRRFTMFGPDAEGVGEFVRFIVSLEKDADFIMYDNSVVMQ